MKTKINLIVRFLHTSRKIRCITLGFLGLFLSIPVYGQNVGDEFWRYMENPDHQPRASNAYDKLYSVKFKVINTSPFQIEAIDFVPDDHKDSGVDDIYNGTVILPKTVSYKGDDCELTNIGDEVFYSINLDKVKLPNSVKTIGDGAFADNSLTEVDIPNSVETIGDGAFTDNSLTHLTIPNSVDTIGDQAFRNNSLTSVTIPIGVETIGDGAFSSNSLTHVTILNSVETIGHEAFQHNSLTSVTIPNSVKTIGNDAFYGNKLIGVNIPASVASIGGSAFAGQNGTVITQVRVFGTMPPSIEATTFSNRDQIDVIVPFGSVDAYKSTDVWKNFKSITAVAEVGGEFTVSGITYEVTDNNPRTVAATDNTNTGSVTIPATVTGEGLSYTVTSIRNSAFRENSLTSVVIPNSVTTIGANAFRTNVLTSSVIPNSVTTIGGSAFQSNQLTHVTFGENLTEIGSAAFWNNDNLATVTLQNSTPPNIVGPHNDAFAEENIDLIVPAGSVTTYEGHEDWNDFKSITAEEEVDHEFTTVDGITYKVTAIDPNTMEAIDYTGSSTSVEIPEEVDSDGNNTYSVTSIGERAFYQNGLIHVDIGDNVTSIGDRAFMNNNLTSMELPGELTTIVDYAFWNNSNLTHVTIPAGVTAIGEGAFGSIENLAEVTVLADDPPALEGDSFGDRTNVDLFVPDGTEQAYLDAGWTGFIIVEDVGDEFIVDGIIYKVIAIDPNTVEAIGYTGSSTSVEIPDTVISDGNNTYTVTSIGTLAFVDNHLEGVTIPNSVTSIGPSAFRNNVLTDVDFGTGNNSLTIGFGSFAGNDLTTVTIPDRVTRIAGWAFRQNALTSVIIGNGVTEIVGGAFLLQTDQIDYVRVHTTDPPSIIADATYGKNVFGDPAQIDLIVPAGSVDDYQNDVDWDDFRSISVEEEVDHEFTTVDGITYKVTAIDPNTVEAIDYTGSSTSVEIPEEVNSDGNNTYSVTSIGDRAFMNNDLTSVELPGGLTTIVDYAFWNNDNLTHVTIPAGVTAIGEGAFGSIENLAEVTVLADDPPALEGDSFGDRTNVDLFVPDGTEQAYLDAGWTGFIIVEDVGDEFIVDGII